MLVNKAHKAHTLINDGIRSYKQVDLFRVSVYLRTPTRLCLVEEQDDDEHDMKYVFSNFCRWNNGNVDMSYKRKLNMFF